MSIRFDKKYIEYVNQVEGGWHVIANLVYSQGGVCVYTHWHDFFRELTRKLPRITFKDNECPLLRKVLAGEIPNINIMELTDPKGEKLMALGSHVRCNTDHPAIEVAGFSIVVQRVQKLMEFSLELFYEVRSSTNPDIKTIFTPLLTTR